MTKLVNKPRTKTKFQVLHLFLFQWITITNHYLRFHLSRTLTIQMTCSTSNQRPSSRFQALHGEKLHQTTIKQNKNKFSSNYRYLHAQNKLKRGKYTDATLEFNMTCTQDHVDKGLSYNIEISSLCSSKKDGFVSIVNVNTCKQITFVTQPQKQKVRMISVTGSSTANFVEMPNLAPFQDIVDAESPVVLHAKVSYCASNWI